MARNLTTAWATVYAATVAGVTTIYTNNKKLEANRELALMNHNWEVERTKGLSYTPSLETSNAVQNSTNSTQVIDKTVLQENMLNNSVEPVKKALMGLYNNSTQPSVQNSRLNIHIQSAPGGTAPGGSPGGPDPRGETPWSRIELNSSNAELNKSLDTNLQIDRLEINQAGFDFSFLFESYLEQSTLQLVCITLLLYNVAIFICIIGLIVNHYTKLYGEQYKDKLPKWSLPIVRYYLKLGKLTNYYYIVSIIVSLLLSISFCILFYFMDIA
jgi:hypothetical protein